MKKVTKFFQFCLLLLAVVLVVSAILKEVVPLFAPRFDASYNTQRRAMGIPLIDSLYGVTANNRELTWLWDADTANSKPSHTAKVITKEGLYTNTETDYFVYGYKKDQAWIHKTTYNWVTKKVTACSCPGNDGDNIDTCRARLKTLLRTDSI